MNEMKDSFFFLCDYFLMNGVNTRQLSFLGDSFKYEYYHGRKFPEMKILKLAGGQKGHLGLLVDPGQCSGGGPGS